MPNKPTKPQNPELGLNLSPDVAEGTYSNLAIITHSPTEFILDFAQMLPGGESDTATIRQRILMHPIHTKRFLMALQENVEKYESNYGRINTNNPTSQLGGTIDLIPRGEA